MAKVYNLGIKATKSSTSNTVLAASILEAEIALN